MDLSKLQKIHFIGIGGIGVSAVARMMLAQNKKVSGSDAAESEITKDLKQNGVKFFLGHKKENITDDFDLVIYSPAVPENNPERQEAVDLGIQQLSYPEFLGELSRQYQRTIAVSGTDGKSTTTAILGLILEAANLDPTVIVGSQVKTFPQKNLRLGQSDYLVVEACEYQANMQKIQPWGVALTNLTGDHFDYYQTPEKYQQAFSDWVKQISQDGFLVLNNDDPPSQELVSKFSGKLITYGIEQTADLQAREIKIAPAGGQQIFKLIWQGRDLGEFKLLIPGKFNISNCLGAIAVALYLGVKSEIIKKVLADFPGIWRRFEKVGEHNGALIISDYGHTPEAVQLTLQAAKEFYPDRRLVIAFQPHHHSRTKLFFQDFISAFDLADLIILNEIYSVVGREKILDQSTYGRSPAGRDISSQDLVDKIKKQGKEVYYSSSLEQTKNLLLEKIQPNDLVLIMGAGDIYQLISELVN